MHITTRAILLMFGLNCLSPVFAADTAIPEPFDGEDPESTLSIGYSDLNEFLKATVFKTGRSNREKASVPVATTGTRLKARINRNTALEGNRFYFETLKEPELQQALSLLQQSLESLPDAVPLAAFNRNEQLAYWLNLYNFTFLNELASHFPARNMRSFLQYGEDDSLMSEKVLKVAGIPLSLNDIQYRILKPKYHSDPLIIYGLFQGNIGGPSIRNRAFTGERVWRDLEDNAAEFINSNRGTYYDGRVSALYQHNMAYFDNNPSRLKDHILDYLEDEMYTEILDARSLHMDIEDWNFASLSGPRQYGGGNMLNNAALLDAVRSSQYAGGTSIAVQNYLGEALAQKASLTQRFSATELKLMKKLRDEYHISNGTVTITDLEQEPASEEQQKKP